MWKAWALLGGTLVILSVLSFMLYNAKSEPSLDGAPETYNWGGQSWLQGAGTPMANGLTVPEGSSLVGPVFTRVTKSNAGEWKVERQSAFLLASSGIDEIAHDLATQAAPPKLTPLSIRGLCVQTIVTDDLTKTQNYTGVVDPDAVDVECVGYQRSGAGLEFTFRQDVPQESSPVQGQLRWFSPADALPPSLPEVPDEVDGPSTVSSGVEGYPDLQIVDGSFLAGPPGWGSLTGGFTAVIGVTGDPDEVFDAYVAQDAEKSTADLETTIDGLRVRQHESAQAGGVWLTITMNEQDGNAWILVEAYND